ncbi:MAG: hypothetical protein AAGF47_09625 [Planctomycetota bacterium]
MTPLRRMLETVHVTAAGLWCGATAMTGAAAAIIFPKVRDLDPTLATYPDYTGEHWRLAAGQVAARLFTVGDAVGFVCAMLAGVSLVLVAAGRDAWRTRAITLTRLTVFSAALGLIAYNLLVLGARMNTNLGAYWRAAAAGENEAAAAAQQAFMADHGPASAVLVAMTLATLALTITGTLGATATPRDDESAGPRNSSIKPSSPRLEKPALAT